MIWNDPNRYDSDIARALATPGGHLSLGRGGFTLHYENARLEGYDCETIKRAAIAAGLPVIDSRCVPFDLAAKLAVKGPMIAVNTPPSPRPWHGFSYAPLAAVAAGLPQGRRRGVQHCRLRRAGRGVQRSPAGAAQRSSRSLARARAQARQLKGHRHE